MRIEELDFPLPVGAIAQRPAEPRDSCRLMRLRGDGSLEHGVFSDLPDLLRPGDLLVLNDSKVLAARLCARRPGGGQTEVLLLHPTSGEPGASTMRWEALVHPSKRIRSGTELELPDGTGLQVTENLGDGRWTVLISSPAGRSMLDVMRANGRLPLPPYIKTYPEDPDSYQTVYASALGSAAAPTAGLHFTTGLLEKLALRGIQTAYVTLHVGLDTFLPIRESLVEDHKIHSETYEVTPEALGRLREAWAVGRRVVAVGTTSARVVETLASHGEVAAEGSYPLRGTSSLYITPGYEFRGVNALLTNFHLPRSTVLALTMAFAGSDRLRQAYAEALALGYRFFSFGDAMLIDSPIGHRTFRGG